MSQPRFFVFNFKKSYVMLRIDFGTLLIGMEGMRLPDHPRQADTWSGNQQASLTVPSLLNKHYFLSKKSR